MSSQESNYRRYNIQKSRLPKGKQLRTKISIGVSSPKIHGSTSSASHVLEIRIVIGMSD